MRRRMLLALALWWLVAALSAQVRPAASLDAIPRSVQAQTSGAAIAAMTLAGTATFLHGSTVLRVGPVTLVALASGACEAIYRMPQGTLTEVWSGPEGSPTDLIQLNGTTTKTPAGGSVSVPGFAWFAPAALLDRAAKAGWGASDHGPEHYDGAPAEHAAIWPQPALGSPGAMPWGALRKQRRVDLYHYSALTNNCAGFALSALVAGNAVTAAQANRIHFPRSTVPNYLYGALSGLSAFSMDEFDLLRLQNQRACVTVTNDGEGGSHDSECEQ